MDNEKNGKIKEAFINAYGILNFTDEQKEKALAEVAGLQQLAISREMIKDLTKDELEALGRETVKGEDQIDQGQIDAILKNHQPGKDLNLKVKLAVERVLRDQIDFLQTLGNDAQKEKIARLFADL